MTKHSVELEGAFVVTKGPRDKSWSAKVELDLAAIPASLVYDLAMHGLKQKIADSASGAQTEAEATAGMQKAVDAILAGEWSVRGEGSSTDPWQNEARSLMKAMMKDKAGAKSPAWAEFTGLSDTDQLAKIDANVEKNRDKIAPLVDARIEAKKEAAKRKKELAVSIEL